MLETHKNGLKPVSDLVAFETGAMGIVQSLFAMELNMYLVQELDKLKENPGKMESVSASCSQDELSKLSTMHVSYKLVVVLLLPSKSPGRISLP